MPNPNHCICVTKPYPSCPIHGDKAKSHHSHVPILSDDELAMSMFVFIERYGHRTLKATAKGCEMVAEILKKEKDPRANDWTEAAKLSQEAAEIAENGNPNNG